MESTSFFSAEQLEHYRAVCERAFVDHDAEALATLTALITLLHSTAADHAVVVVVQQSNSPLRAALGPVAPLRLTPEEWAELETIKSAVRRRSHAIMHQRRVDALNEALAQESPPALRAANFSGETSRALAAQLTSVCADAGLPVLLAIAWLLDTQLKLSHFSEPHAAALVLPDAAILEVGSPSSIKILIRFLRFVLHCDVATSTSLSLVDHHLWQVGADVSDVVIASVLSALPVPSCTRARNWHSVEFTRWMTESRNGDPWAQASASLRENPKHHFPYSSFISTRPSVRFRDTELRVGLSHMKQPQRIAQQLQHVAACGCVVLNWNSNVRSNATGELDTDIVDFIVDAPGRTIAAGSRSRRRESSSWGGWWTYVCPDRSGVSGVPGGGAEKEEALVSVAAV